MLQFVKSIKVDFTVRTREIETTLFKTGCLVPYEKAINLETGWYVSYNLIKKPKVTSMFFPSGKHQGYCTSG